MDATEVYRVALRTRPMETFAKVAPDEDPRECLAALHELEDEDVRFGVYTAFDGASQVLGSLPSGAWALVTSNYEHRVRGRFTRAGLPVRRVIVDAAAVEEGKPSPFLPSCSSVSPHGQESAAPGSQRCSVPLSGSQ